MHQEISTESFDRKIKQDGNWCTAHVYREDDDDLKLLLNRKELDGWLRRNWNQRYTEPLSFRFGRKREECLIRKLYFKPGVVSSYQYSLLYVELMSAKKVLRSGKIKVPLHINYNNVSKLKFGIFNIIKRSLVVRLRSLRIKTLDVNVPEYLSTENRTLRISDLPKNDNYRITHGGDLTLCKVLRSSKERRSLHTQWIKRKQGTGTT